MFATLLESRFRREGHEGSMSVSSLLHVAFLCGGVLLSQDRRVISSDEVTRDTLVFIDAAPRPRPTRIGPGGGVGLPSARMPEPVFVLTTDPVLDDGLIAVDSFPSSAITGGPGGGARVGEPSATGIFAAATVEKPAVSLAGNRPPTYPEMLRTAGVEGSALMQFVIDTAGWVEPSSITALRADHDLFAVSARVALLRHRFLPAEIAGRKVRMLVEQRFDFAIERR